MKNIVHWCKQKSMWTSHTYKSCTKASVVLVHGGWSTEIKPERKSNPRGWVVTDDNHVIINPEPTLLERYSKAQQLVYDKVKMAFNISEGDAILFDTDGAYVLKER